MSPPLKVAWARLAPVSAPPVVRIRFQDSCQRSQLNAMVGKGLRLLVLLAFLVGNAFGFDIQGAARRSSKPKRPARLEQRLASPPLGAAVRASPPPPRAESRPEFYQETATTYESYAFNRDVGVTKSGILSGSRSLVDLVSSRVQVSRITITQSFGMKYNDRWSFRLEVPYSRAHFDGRVSDLQLPPALSLANGTLQESVVDANGVPATQSGESAFGLKLGATPGNPTRASIDLSHLKDATVHSRWQINGRDTNVRSFAVDLAFGLPTGQARLAPDQQLLITALGESSLDVYEPYFGKGFNAAIRPSCHIKRTTDSDIDLTLAYVSTGTYDQTISPQLPQFFNPLESIAPDLTDPIPAASRIVTSRNPADQLSFSAAFTRRPHSRRRDQYAIASIVFLGESVTNPAGVAFGRFGERAPPQAELEKSPTYQLAYTIDRRVTKTLFERLRLFYQLQGTNDILPPAGFIVRNVEFGDRYGADLQFRKGMGSHGSTFAYGLRSNNITEARLLPSADAFLLPAARTVSRSARRELSGYLGLEQEFSEYRLSSQVRVGFTEDAPNLIVQAGVRRDF